MKVAHLENVKKTPILFVDFVVPGAMAQTYICIDGVWFRYAEFQIEREYDPNRRMLLNLLLAQEDGNA